MRLVGNRCHHPAICTPQCALVLLVATCSIYCRRRKNKTTNALRSSKQNHTITIIKGHNNVVNHQLGRTDTCYIRRVWVYGQADRERIQKALDQNRNLVEEIRYDSRLGHMLVEALSLCNSSLIPRADKLAYVVHTAPDADIREQKMKYALLACSILLFVFLLSCAPFGSTVQPQPKQLTVVQQIIQQNKDSIRNISSQINQDYQIGYRTHKLFTQVQPESDLHYKQLGKIVQSIVKQVQLQANKSKTQRKDRAKTAAVAVVSIICLCAIYRSCKRVRAICRSNRDS